MDPKEFISSGIIESYLLGFASEAESKKVSEMERLHPDVKNEINTIEQTLFEFASLHKQIVPPGIKEKLFNQLEFNVNENGRVIPLKPEPSTNWQRRQQMLTYLVAASIVLLLISMYVNLMFFRKVSFLQEQVSNFISQKDALVMQVSYQQQKIDATEKEMKVTLDPGYTKVTLKGMDRSPKSLALIFWNSNTKEVFMHVNSLPQPALEKQYQLWAIVDGKPVDEGMLDMSTDLLAMHGMKPVSNPQAFAVTLENKGGSPVPTLSEMYLMGNL